MEYDEKSTESSFHAEIYREQQEDAQKRLEYSVGYAQSALKSLFFLNGGSVIAILTIVGNAHSSLNGRGIFWALLWFILGLATDLIAYFGAYFSQSEFMNASYARAKNALGKALGIEIQMPDEEYIRRGSRWIGLSVTMAVTSFLLFGIGAFVALFAIL